jgi:MAP/microtubule affinity-regulating kinase
LVFDLSDELSLKHVVKQSMKKLIGKDDYHGAKVYNKNGVLIFESDFNLLHNGDILYLASKGEDFSYAAMLDDYELGKTLGVGGFGKVILGKHRETRGEVAIKFSDVGD